MSATLTGTVVGIWGLASAETAQGIIIESLEEASDSEKSYVRNHSGERVGRSDYDERIDVSIAAEVLTGSSFSQKLAAELTLTNSISLANINPAGPGKTLISSYRRTRNREDWEKVQVEAEVLPYMT